MATKPTIPSQYLPQPCGGSPRLTIFTHSTDFLYLIVSDEQPKRKPRFKTIRGLRYECGRQWEFVNPVCIPQMNIPTNTYHIFPLPTRNIGACVWYAITNACRADEATSFSPPIQYCYVDCPVNGGFIEMTRCPTTELGGNYSPAFRDVTNGNPAMRVNDLTIKVLVDGAIQCDANAIVRADPNANGNWTGEMYFRRSDGTEFGHSSGYSTDRDQEITITASGSIYAFANQLFTVHFRRTSGTNLLQRPASLNGDSRWTVSPL